MNLKFIKSGEKKKIVRELEERFGIEKIPGVLVEAGKEKVRGFSGSMTREEIKELCRVVNVEVIGIYLIKRERDLRLSLDGVHVLGGQIDKGVVEISDSELAGWMRGKDLCKKVEKGVFVLKHGEDFVGCGVSNGEKIFNYVPKERRIRKNS